MASSNVNDFQIGVKVVSIPPKLLKATLICNSDNTYSLFPGFVAQSFDHAQFLVRANLIINYVHENISSIRLHFGKADYYIISIPIDMLEKNDFSQFKAEPLELAKH